MKFLLAVLLFFCVPVFADVEEITVHYVFNGKVVIKRASGERYLLDFGVGCVSIENYVNQPAQVFLRFNGALTAYDSSILIPTAKEECSISKVELVRSTANLSTTTAPGTPAKPSTSPGYDDGRVVGAAIGSAMYQARLKHAINKACFDQGSQGWTLPNGATIYCGDWSRANPRQMKGTPNGISSDPNIDRVCQETPKQRYMVQANGLWYSYPCQDWRKVEHPVPSPATTSPPEPVKTQEAKTTQRLDVAMMNAAREELTTHPSSTEAKRQWEMGVQMYCRQDANALYKGTDGRTESCGGEAKQFYDLLDQLRVGINEVQRDLDAESPKRDSMARALLPGIIKQWQSTRDTYCKLAPQGRYLDLANKEQSCRDAK